MISDPIAPSIRTEITQRLAALEQQENIHILLAVESGSRAWGFPSPDSDYDIRFLYIRPRNWYLKLQAGRDVVETPIEGEIDLNGWDIRKVLLLLLKSNAVISEWISSPIRYRTDHPIIRRLALLADDVLDARALAHHYASLGRNAAERWLSSDGPVPVKKYFYALRPALAIRCLRLAPKQRPPMNLQALMAHADLSESLKNDINGLVAAKARTHELGNTTRLPALENLIRDELSRPGELPARPGASAAHQMAHCDQIFLDLVESFPPL
ncbi:MAG: nucleotidyltransferase domain-containing protein [Acetobacter cibinongensis]